MCIRDRVADSTSKKGLGTDLGWFPFPAVTGGAGAPTDGVGGAFLPTAMPLPPPTPSVGAPAPPVTAGNGNHPRSVPRPFLLVLSATSTPGAHWPISSIAALPLPTAAASLSYDALL